MLRDLRLKNSAIDQLLLISITLLGLLSVAAPNVVLLLTPNCIITSLTGFKHCWGCGITHAALQLIHGNFKAAWHFNPLIFLVLPLLFVEYLRFGLRVFSLSHTR